MAVRKRRGQTEQVHAAPWPKGLSNEEIAEFVAAHDLASAIGTGRPVRVKFPPGLLRRTQEKRAERLLVALRLERKDLQQIRRIAKERDIPYTALMRSWIRAGLRRERQKAG